MRVDETRIKQINALADKLLRQQSQQGSQSAHNHQRRRDDLNEKWKLLQIAIENYRNKLQNALEVHRFNRDLDDLNDRISEKSLILEKEDEVKNLEGVEALQRKQEKIEREVNAIEIRLKDLIENEGRRLIGKYPDMTQNCRNKINDVQENWRRLSKLCHLRRNRLSSAYTLHKFLEELKEIENWANNVINHRMNKTDIVNNITDVKNDLQLHEDIKAEILAKRDSFQNLKEFGHKLLQQMSQQQNDDQNEQLNKQLIENGLSKLDDLRRLLDQVWEDRKHSLTQCLQMQLFNELLKQADAWLSSKEAFLNNEDLGDTLASVESLIKKHDNFEKTLSTQQRIVELGKFANDLIQKNHFESETIVSKCRATVARKDRLLELSKQRKNKLNDSKLFQKFLRNVYEILGWLNEKLKVASDESYRDPINLLSKIQKHAAFEAELAANKGRIDSITNEGEAIINSGHFLSQEIQTHLSHIEKSWRNLLDQTNLKKERLQDAYQALQFHRMLDDLETWMTEIESVLADEDHGKDLISSQNIMKKHQLIENDINNHSENIEQIKDLTTAFNQNNHFLKEEIEERAQQVIQRYDSLHEPMQIRRENLEEALLLFQFKRDVEDELIWMNEKEPQARAIDLGNNLSDVQKLRKKHQAFEAEIAAREPLLTTIFSKGHSLIRSQHFASNEIESLINELQTKMQAIKDAAALRRLRLLDAVESQQFYTDVAEAENWWKERIPFLMSEEIGRDEESVITLSKKLEVIKRDSERFVSNNLAKIFQLGYGLIERNHFDTDIIKAKISELENKFKELSELCSKKSLSLAENRKYFGFVRDADELLVWIKEQMIVASSEDYGQDVEHVELLIQRFDNFIINLNSNEERIASLRLAAEALKESNDKMKYVLMAWNELKDMAQSRQDALNGAKQVHTFDRSADETIAWIHEKDSSTALDENNSPDDDLQSIQTMIRSHEGFERDLAAVREQVEALLEEAKRLATLFPDASEHIYAKNDQVRESWNDLLHKSAQRRNHLLQAETLQTYFDEYRELLAWINEMIALITSEDELANRDVISAETQLNRHKEYKTEIDARNDSFIKFANEGESIINSGHFMSGEVRERLNKLNSAHNNLLGIWNKRRIIYEHNLDAQLFKHDAEQLERWLNSRESFVSDPRLGDSIADVEDLIRKHEDFEKAVIAQEEKLKSIQRITLIEEYFRKQKQEEEVIKKENIARKEQERVQQLKQREQMRILDERKQEDDNYYDNGDIRRTSQEHDSNSKGLVKRVENLLVPKAVKRAESVKFASPKRTPSFTTRRRSFRSSSRQPAVEPDQLPPVECEGMLDRKQELQAGGKRATVRSWKSYYTVLCGQLLCFFKDKDSFFGNQAAAPPFSVLGAKCSRALDYTKRKYVFRLQLSDGSEFLFTSHEENRMQEWLNKIAFHASLPPSMQLLSYDAHKDASIYSGASNTSLRPQNNNENTSPSQSNTVPKYDTSSQSSSSPELSRDSSVSSYPMGSAPATTSRSSLPVSSNSLPSPQSNDSANRRAPPLPPPRTTNAQKQSPNQSPEVIPNIDFAPQRPVSERFERQREEVDNQRHHSYRQSYPQREQLSSHNGDYGNNHEKSTGESDLKPCFK
jgi:spectrin beta